MMNKNLFAPVPPMGWNSYDYYDTTVTEEAVKKNADYMAAHLKSFGWEYIVVDIEWYAYDAGTQREEYQYIPFWKVEMDEFGRLLPCPQRFPSSVGGKGFKPLADYVHEKGLKFGIHIMRGLPREAAHRQLPIRGCDRTCNQIAQPNNICAWNPDMYGINPEKDGAQQYYDSLFSLYAEWGVDFVKCDDICRMDMPTAKGETAMLHRAIEKCGRPIVLSLSPGPARIEEAFFYEQNANMWRITDDFWDIWHLLKAMFERCRVWQKHVTPGNYPDCDMLPVGKVGAAFGHEHDSGLTCDEQHTMMNLWCIFRSPLMLGCELTKLDEDTFRLITNEILIRCNRNAGSPVLLEESGEHAVWFNRDDTYKYLAVFNISDEEKTIVTVPLGDSGILKKNTQCLIDAWSGDDAADCLDGEDRITVTLRPHASVFFEIL